MIGFLYILTNEFDGGGGDPVVPQAPKNYKPLSVAQRNDWNGFLDYVGKTPNANLADSNALFSEYKKSNPNFSLSPTDLQNIQYEQYQLRKGDTFGSLDKDKLKYIRQGLPESYLNKPIGDINGKLTPETSKLYYPQVGKYGTDIEGYYNSKTGRISPVSNEVPPSSKSASQIKNNSIPLPDYSNSESRLKYAQDWAKKYGPLMQKRGDTPLRVNEKPPNASDTAKNISIKAASQLGIDPTLLYASSMEEGMSGLFPDQHGAYDVSTDKQYPVNGSHSFGLDQFVSEFPKLVEKGYLPKNFDFKQWTPPEGSGITKNSAVYKSVDDALLAKAAYLKDNYDTIDEYSKKSGESLTPKARDFFSLVAYNAGSGTAKKMIDDYKANGQLKGDKFLKERPTSGKGLKDSSYKQVYENVIRRIKMADALKNEGLF